MRGFLLYNVVMNALKRDNKGLLVKGTPPGPGRPKGSISIKDKIRKRLQENPDQFDSLVDYYMENEQPVMRKLLWEMLDGKPKESVDATIHIPKPIDDVLPNHSDQEDKEAEEEN